ISTCIASGKGKSKRSTRTPSQRLPRTPWMVPFWVYTPVCKAQRVPAGVATTQYKKPHNRANNRITMGPNQMTPLRNHEEEEDLLKMRSLVKSVNECSYHVARRPSPHKKDPPGFAPPRRPRNPDGF